MAEIEDENWTLVIRPQKSWFDIHLSEVWKYRDLILLFVRRDFAAQYKQTILGPLWYLLQPLITTAIYLFSFGFFLNISTDQAPKALFYLSGIIMWTYFADCLTKTSNTFIVNAHIFGKVYFPRLVIPISVVISNMIRFIIQFSLFIAVLVYYILQTDHGTEPNAYLLLLPLLLIIMAGLGLGLGIIVSSLTTKYRDLSYLVGFAVQLLMFLSPVIYPVSLWGEHGWIMLLNPMSSVIEAFRYGFMGTGSFPLLPLCYSFAVTVLILAAGTLLFNRVEKSFMDTI